jgi:hypothetical protein
MLDWDERPADPLPGRLPGVIPDNRVLLRQRRHTEPTPISDLVKRAAFIRGTISGLDAHGVAWLRSQLVRRELRRCDLVFSLYGGCPTWDDVLIANPPFGKLRDGGSGEIITWTGFVPEMPDWSTSEIDHYIAARSLSAMPDTGSAVLILGGPSPQALEAGANARAKAYAGNPKMSFYYWLYRNHRVVEHFTVKGDLYGRMGANWPVDVVVIRGRGAAMRDLPARQPPRLFNTWDELFEGVIANGRLAELDSLGVPADASGRRADDGAGREGAGPNPAADAGGLQRPADRPVERPGGEARPGGRGAGARGTGGRADTVDRPAGRPRGGRGAAHGQRDVERDVRGGGLPGARDVAAAPGAAQLGPRPGGDVAGGLGATGAPDQAVGPAALAGGGRPAGIGGRASRLNALLGGAPRGNGGTRAMVATDRPSLRPGWDPALYEQVKAEIDGAVQDIAADLQGADVRDIARAVLGAGWTL